MKKIHIKYQIYSTLKKSEVFTIDVYYSILNHIIDQNYCVTWKLENQQTMVIGPKFILL